MKKKPKAEQTTEPSQCEPWGWYHPTLTGTCGELFIRTRSGKYRRASKKLTMKVYEQLVAEKDPCVTEVIPTIGDLERQEANEVQNEN
jgi:hypothetical protein